MSDSIQCEECKVYGSRHQTYCSQSTATREEIQAAAKYYFEKWCRANSAQHQIREDAHSRAQARITKAKKEAALWHGKYAIVKVENNALRTKLHGASSKSKPAV